HVKSFYAKRLQPCILRISLSSTPDCCLISPETGHMCPHSACRTSARKYEVRLSLPLNLCKVNRTSRLLAGVGSHYACTASCQQHLRPRKSADSERREVGLTKGRRGRVRRPRKMDLPYETLPHRFVCRPSDAAARSAFAARPRAVQPPGRRWQNA